MFFPRCQKKHLAMDCPLDSVTISAMCVLKHSIYFFPTLPGMSERYQRYLRVEKNSLQHPCKSWPTCIFQNSIPPSPYSHTQSLNTLLPWQLLQPQFNSYLPYPQCWNGLAYAAYIGLYLPRYQRMTTF